MRAWTSASPPARPHHRLTADGRRMREVLSYSRRGNRFTPSQAAAWAAHHEGWVIPDEAVDQPGVLAGRLVRARGAADRRDRLGRRRGDRGARRGPAGVRRAGLRGVAARRRRHPVAAGRGRRRQRAADRRRRGLVARAPASSPGALAELWTFFPDPWPKTRHHKRRLVDPGVRRRWPRAGSPRARPGGWPPTGPTTPTRCARCSTPSRLSRAARCRGGTTGR